MATILHLSDLHLGADEEVQEPLFASLVNTLRGRRADLLVFTGDVFDSSRLEPSATIGRFTQLLEDCYRALGGPMLTLVLPGNHDRRDAGVFGTVDARLFDALAEAMRARPHVRVLGCQTPFLAQPVDAPGLPAHLVAYDSTYLPRGLVSAGGVMRPEDLLQVAQPLLQSPDELPLLFLVHHHLIPTPITDLGQIDVSRRGLLDRLLVSKVLPALVANADREELTMTALGAGTALSTLHGYGRAVCVLHGHKHYPTARLLKGLRAKEGDVLLLAAGSCGTSETFRPTESDQSPRLWPSFNQLELTERALTATTVAFPPAIDERTVFERPLLSARRRGRFWRASTRPEKSWAADTYFALNEARFRLSPSRRFPGRFDVEVSRRLQATARFAFADYAEDVEAVHDARLVQEDRGVELPGKTLPAQVTLPATGQVRYVVQGGVHATVESAAEQGPGTAFGWVGLLNRYSTSLARLTLEVPALARPPFASVTDLMSGQEQALPLGHRDGAFVLERGPLRPRSLLRIYLPLA